MSFTIHDPRHWLDVVPEILKASALYTELWEQMKHDAEILAFLELVDKDQPLPLTFFTVVNFLVLGEPDHPLAWYYPYLHPEGTPPLSDAYPLFRAFVLTHLEAVYALLPGARLQTNEATRCSNLLPAFALAYQRGGEKPLNMIEIGSSAGFNLLWSLYRYQYTSVLLPKDILIGEPSSPVCIHCEINGMSFPPLPDALPRVARCQGIELVPRDLYSEKDMRWVRAAIWPEEYARYQLFDAVITFARKTPFLLQKGNACEHLPKLLAAIPEKHTGVVWHSYALNQGPMEVQQHIEQQIVAASYRIPLYRVSLEFALEKEAGPRLELYEYQQGKMVKQDLLARCAVHGEGMEWLLGE